MNTYDSETVCSNFPGAYLTEDARVVRGTDVPFTMLREGLRS
jgi:hypothetical protein